MNFVYDNVLLQEMRKKNRKNIAIEVAASNHSDIEVTELWYRFVKDSYADYLVEEKKYRTVTTEVGRVLLPPYRLHYDETVRFYLQKHWIFTQLKAEGVHL